MPQKKRDAAAAGGYCHGPEKRNNADRNKKGETKRKGESSELAIKLESAGGGGGAKERKEKIAEKRKREKTKKAPAPPTHPDLYPR